MALLLGFLLSGCTNPVNPLFFSRVSQAKIIVESMGAAGGDTKTLDLGGTPFAGRRSSKITLRNKGNIPAGTLHFRVESESSVDGLVFSIQPGSDCREGMNLSHSKDHNTCSLEIVFNAPVPLSLAELGTEGKPFQGQLTIDYDTGYIESGQEQGRRVMLNVELAARSIAEPSFTFTSAYVSDLPGAGSASTFITGDRVNFDSSALVSSSFPIVSNPDYVGGSIRIPVRFNGSLLPLSECQAFIGLHSNFNPQILSVQNLECVKNDLITPFLSDPPGRLQGVPKQPGQWTPCSASMTSASSIQFNASDGMDFLRCNSDPSDMTYISAHIDPSQTFHEAGDVEYLTVKKLRSVIYLQDNPAESTVVEVMAQAPKLSRPSWRTEGNNTDSAELTITSPLGPMNPVGYTVAPRLTWPTRLSKINPSLSGLDVLRARLNQVVQYQVGWMAPSPSLIPLSDLNCTGESFATSPVSLASHFISGSTLAAQLAPDRQNFELGSTPLQSSLPNHYHRVCIRAVDAFGNRSGNALYASAKSQDIPPIHFSPSPLSLSQVSRSHQITLTWADDTADQGLSKLFGKLDHYAYRVLPQDGSAACNSRTDFASASANTVACSDNSSQCSGSIELTNATYPGAICVLIQACNADGRCIPTLAGADEVSGARSSLEVVPPAPTVFISPSPSPRSSFDLQGVVSWYWTVQYQSKTYPSPSPISGIPNFDLSGTAGLTSSALTYLSLNRVNAGSGTPCVTGYPNCRQHSGSFSGSYSPAAAGSYTVEYQSSPVTTLTLTAPTPFALTAASINANRELALSGSPMVADNFDHYEVDSWRNTAGNCASVPQSYFNWSGPGPSAAGPSPFPSVVPSFTSATLVDNCSAYGNYCTRLKACDAGVGVGKLCATQGPRSFFYEVTGAPVIRPSPSVSPSLAISPSPSPMVSILPDGSTRTYRVFTWNPKFEVDVPLSATVSAIDVKRKLDAAAYARIPSGSAVATYAGNSLPSPNASCGRQIYAIGLQADGGAQTSVGVGIQPNDFMDHTVCYQITVTYRAEGAAADSSSDSSEYCYKFANSQDVPTVSWSSVPSLYSQFNSVGEIQRTWTLQGQMISKVQTLIPGDLKLKRTIQSGDGTGGVSSWSGPLPPPSALPSCTSYASSSMGPWCYQLTLNQDSASTADEVTRGVANQKLDTPSTSDFFSDSGYLSIATSRVLNYRLELPGQSVPAPSPSWSLTIPGVSGRFQLNDLSYVESGDTILLTANPMVADSLHHYEIESWIPAEPGNCSASPNSNNIHSWTGSSTVLPSSVNFSQFSPPFDSCTERTGGFCARIKACTVSDSVCATTGGRLVNRSVNHASIDLRLSESLSESRRVQDFFISQYGSSAYAYKTTKFWNANVVVDATSALSSVIVRRAHRVDQAAYPNDSDVIAQLASGGGFVLTRFGGGGGGVVPLPAGSPICANGGPINRYSMNLRGVDPTLAESSGDLDSRTWTEGNDFSYHKICYQVTASAGDLGTPAVAYYCTQFHFSPPSLNLVRFSPPWSSFDTTGRMFWTWSFKARLTSQSSSMVWQPGHPGSVAARVNGVYVDPGATYSDYFMPYLFNLYSNYGYDQFFPGNIYADSSDAWVRSSTPGGVIQLSLQVGGRELTSDLPSGLPSVIPVPSPSASFHVTGVSYDSTLDQLSFLGTGMLADSLTRYEVVLWKKTGAGTTCGSAPAAGDLTSSPISIPANSQSGLPQGLPLNWFFTACDAPPDGQGTLLCAGIRACQDLPESLCYDAPIIQRNFRRTQLAPIYPQQNVSGKSYSDWIFNWKSYFGDGLTTPIAVSADSGNRTWDWRVPFKVTLPGNLQSLVFKKKVLEKSVTELDWVGSSSPPDFTSEDWASASSSNLTWLDPSVVPGCSYRTYTLNIGDLDAETSAGNGPDRWQDSEILKFRKVCYEVTATAVTGVQFYGGSAQKTLYLCHSFQVGPRFRPAAILGNSSNTGRNTGFIFNRASSPAAYPMATSGFNFFRVGYGFKSESVVSCGQTDIDWYETAGAGANGCRNNRPGLCQLSGSASLSDSYFGGSYTDAELDRRCAKVDACERMKDGSGEIHCTNLPGFQLSY